MTVNHYTNNMIKSNILSHNSKIFHRCFDPIFSLGLLLCFINTTRIYSNLFILSNPSHCHVNQFAIFNLSQLHLDSTISMFLFYPFAYQKRLPTFASLSPTLSFVVHTPCHYRDYNNQYNGSSHRRTNDNPQHLFIFIFIIFWNIKCK